MWNAKNIGSFLSEFLLESLLEAQTPEAEDIDSQHYQHLLTDDIVSEHAACELFSTIDLPDAFHQVANDPDSHPLMNIQLPPCLCLWRWFLQEINQGPQLLQRDIDATCESLR